MALHRPFLDKLNPNVRGHVRQIGGDPDFVDFLLGWYGLLQIESSLTEGLPLKTWPYWSTSRQRQVKRELRRRHGRTWKTEWVELQACARNYEPPRLKAGLFSIDTQGPKPSHGPFQWNFWLALCDAKHYFTRINTRPHWDVIAEVFFPKYSFEYAQAEWARRKKRLSRFDHEESLNRTLNFYETYKPVVLKVLTSGVPIWASPHREHFERLHAKAGLDTLLRRITGPAQVSHVVLHQPMASDENDYSNSKRNRRKQASRQKRAASRRPRSLECD